MTLREIFRFELTYQIHRLATGFCFAGLFVFGFVMMWAGDADGSIRSTLAGGAFFNVLAFLTAMGTVLWLLLAGTVAGDAAARDVETRLHPLIYTAPIRKADYLGGRFLAAFALNASMLFALQIGLLLSPLLLGPSLPVGPLAADFLVAHLAVYFVLAVPTVFVATAIQFAAAVRQGRAMFSYLSGVLLLVASVILPTVMAEVFRQRQLARLMDPLGFVSVLRAVEDSAAVARINPPIVLEGWMLASRLVWVGVALGVLALTGRRFEFHHRVPRLARFRISRPAVANAPARLNLRPFSAEARDHVRQVERRRFSLTTAVRQTLAIAWTSFGTIARSPIGLTVVGALAFGSAVVAEEWMVHVESIPLLPRTEEVLAFYAPPLDRVGTVWIIIPLLIIFHAGELVWRERDAGMNEIVDSAPIPGWALFSGKYLGLALVLVVWMATLMAAGVLVQVVLGYPEFNLGVSLSVLFGFQLADYLLLALLVLVVHTLAGQKALGHVAAVGAYGLISFAPRHLLAIEHKLLVYGSDPGWSYTPMTGFGPSVGPWLWFNLYWAGWALALAVAARLLLRRGTEAGLRVRLRMARRRFTSATAGVTVAAATLVVAAGGFIFYNTNVLNAYRTAGERIEERAEYERRYRQYEGVAQPGLTDVNLHVEIHPERREVAIRGTFHLVNSSPMAIDSIHLAPGAGVATGEAVFDRPVARAVVDDELRYRIYWLEQPLQPGGSLELRFNVRSEPRGFTNTGADASVVANGTYFTNLSWLPAIGYQPNRELTDESERRAHGLAPRQAIPSRHDNEALRVRVDSVVGTAEDQIAVAPGVLRRTWMENGRRYFHYLTEEPIGRAFAVFSAKYAVREEEWTGSGQPVTIQIFHHPSHTHNLLRIIRGVNASLSYYTTQFGAYPFGHVRFVERPGRARGMQAEATTVDYQEGFSLLNPRADQDPDLAFAVVARGMAYQWWGARFAHARVEGSEPLSDSLTTYSSMRLIEETFGRRHLRRYLRFLRLHATDDFLSYGRGPRALYAFGEYIGKQRVHEALRRLLETHGGGRTPPPTAVDLQRELLAVTPESFRSLFHDLFQVNVQWELAVKNATANQTADGSWQVILDVTARKLLIDGAGIEREAPMDDWIEIALFAEGDRPPTMPEVEQVGDPDDPFYLQKHRIRSGPQTITLTTSRKSGHAGIDPNLLLNEVVTSDNFTTVKTTR